MLFNIYIVSAIVGILVPLVCFGKMFIEDIIKEELMIGAFVTIFTPVLNTIFAVFVIWITVQDYLSEGDL